MIGGAGLLVGWSAAGPVAAQPAAAPVAAPSTPQVQRNYLNKNVIQLPILINEQARSLIAEVQLYVKEQPGAAWTQRDKVGPTAKAFTFQVPQDGEYWFAMVTVDKQGRSFPSDLRNEPPGLVVVIDTQPPTLELISAGQSPAGQLIQLEVRDTNLNNARTQLHYQGGDGVFRGLEPVPGRPGVFCLPAQAVSTGLIRASAEDLAGNQNMREAQASQLPTAKAAAAAPNVGGQLPLVEPKNAPPKLPANVQDAPPLIPDLPRKPTTTPGRPDGSEGPRLPGAVTEAQALLPAPPQVRDDLKRQFVNSTKVFLDYQIENAAQANVGKVEVWITRDRAKSWQKISEQAQQKSPIEVQFPGEGIFGVTLIATNGRTPSTPPAAGDTPDWWIEVDTTRPTVQLTKIQSATEAGKAVVTIAWTATDANLANSPVELSYGPSPQGPWQPIAKDLPAQGEHRWTPAADAGAKTYFQITVRDVAGNIAATGTLDAITFAEPSRPRAVIRGISTGTPNPAPMTPPSAPQPRFPGMR